MPEGSAEDESDEDGGMPEDQEDEDECPGPSDVMRSRTESLGDTHEAN